MAYAESEYRNVAVHHADGRNHDVADGERLVRFHFHEVELRHTWIFVFNKAVRHVVADVFSGAVVGVDVYVAKHAKGAQVVHAAHVVVVRVGDKYSVNLPEWLFEHLFAEVGTAVDEHPGGVGFHECRAAQSAVVRVGAGANWALASQNRHAATCSCA